MDTVPFSYDALNVAAGVCPQSFIHIHNTGAARFFKRYLLMDALSVFDWKLPDNWDADYFRYIIMGFGKAVIFRTDLFGVIPQYANLFGYNVFYRPTKAVVSNPLLESRELTIGVDCALIKLCPDYGSIADLVDYYGDLMALAYESLSVNILNSRLAYLIGVSNKAEADTFKAIYDDIASGKPAVVWRGKDAARGAQMLAGKPTAGPDQWQTVLQNIRQSFIAPDLMDVLADIRDEYLTQIGIPSLSERKKERVNLVDSERNNVETSAKITLWFEELKAGIAKSKVMFPELENTFDVKIRFPVDKEVDGVVGETDSDRPI